MRVEELSEKWADPSCLATAICQILVIIEGVNAFAANRTLSGSDQAPSSSAVLLAYRDRLSSNEGWSKSIELVELLRGVGIEPPYDKEFATSLLNRLLGFPLGQTGGVARHNVRAVLLPRLPYSSFLEHRAWIDGSRLDRFSTRILGDRQGVDLGRVRGRYCDQFLDPMATCHRILMEVFPRGGRIERAEYILQRALRRYFSLREYSAAVKYRFASLAPMMNELFYGAAFGRVEEVQSLHSAIIGTKVVVERIAKYLSDSMDIRGGDNKVNLDHEATSGDLIADRDTVAELVHTYGALIVKQAIGVVMFARFCRLLRVRYFRLDLTEKVPAEARSSVLFRGQYVTQGFSAVRRLEAGYFLNRVFGSISEISGLNFIFRGGILPQPAAGRAFSVSGPPGSGKTVFSLQKICGVAARGGLAVYFSFEERVDLLLDRLVTFGLLENARYDVVVGGQDELEKLAKSENKKGVLFLFTLGGTREYPLLGAMRYLAELKHWNWRAIVIDSVNALHLVAEQETGRIESPSLFRVAIRDLVEEIDRGGYLGILIAEEYRGRFDEIEYLADTAIRFGFGQNDRGRWLEIRKCRSQDFHAGRHKTRFVEGEGISIVPSMGAIRSALRRRIKSTLSDERVIVLGRVGGGQKIEVAEKSTTLVFGGSNSMKAAVVLDLALGEVSFRKVKETRDFEGPRSVLVVNFKSTEERFLAGLRSNKEALAAWQRLRYSKVRWLSPGETMTADEVVWEIWQEIQKARRRGLGIERIVFDEIENVRVALPSVAAEGLFWPTLLQLTSAEAITTVLGLGLEEPNDMSDMRQLYFSLSSEADYVINANAEGVKKMLFKSPLGAWPRENGGPNLESPPLNQEPSAVKG